MTCMFICSVYACNFSLISMYSEMYGMFVVCIFISSLVQALLRLRLDGRCARSFEYIKFCIQMKKRLINSEQFRRFNTRK